MRKLLVNTFMTLDGVMQAPGGPDEDPTGGFLHGGWAVPHFDEVMGEAMSDLMDRPFALLLGRKTYEIFAAHWPHVGEGEREARGGTPSDVDDPAAEALNRATKYVASRTLDKVEWNNSHLLEGDVADAIAKLKAESGPEIQVHESANLMQTLIKHDLVDEYQLLIFPVLLGNGKRLFDEGTIPAGLKLVDTKTSGTGVVIAVYERAGELEHGSYEFDQPTDEGLERRRRLTAE